MATYRPETRPDGRPDPREASAADKTAAILERIDNQNDFVPDRFQIDPDDIPEGLSYEWKRYTTMGQENRHYERELTKMGWEPVPAKRHPDLMPTNYKGNTIEMDGLVLMERPKVITDRVRERDLRIAKSQVRDNEVQLGQAKPGTMDRTLTQVKKSHSPVDIPE